MANKWKISTTDKKSIVDHWFFVKNGDETKWAKVEELWRWGYVVVESMKKPKIDSKNVDGFNIYDFDVWDQETDDGCGTWFEFSDSVSEDERADFENAYYEGLEEVNNLGWLDDDNDRIFIGPVEIEKYK